MEHLKGGDNCRKSFPSFWKFSFDSSILRFFKDLYVKDSARKSEMMLMGQRAHPTPS